MPETINTTCHLCGNEWNYSGTKRGDELITCPSCNSKTLPGDESRDGRDRSGGRDVQCSKCDYEWKYVGDRDPGSQGTCPRCGRYTTV